MRSYLKKVAALGLGLAAVLGNPDMSDAQPASVIAIDIALEPDATMIRHAKASNARLLKADPTGFALDATHNPHVTLLQQFVRTADLDKIDAAVSAVFAAEKPKSWKLKAFKYYYIAVPPIGLAGIVVEPTEDLQRLQQKVIDAVLPFTVKTGTAAAFVSTEEGRDIQPFLIEYVTNFISIGSGKKFNPH
ncbi:MAG: 2'-5' RNA ligase family protein, partial [Pseudorhodoplanes sp.]